MAREVGIKVKVDGSASAVGIRSIEDNMKRAAEAMKSAIKSGLGSAFDWTKTKWAGAKDALEKPIKEGVKAGKAAFAGLFSDVSGMISTVGGLVGGIGMAELAKGAIEAKAKWGDLRFGIQAAGGTAKQARDAQAQAQTSALAWAQDSMKVVDAFQAIRGETGSIDFAQASIDTVSQAARGAHKSLEGMAAVTGTLNEKFGITAEELPDALADVVGLSEKGGVSFEDMSEKLGQVGAFAKQAGLQGRDGLAQIIGLMNVADNSTGNLKKGMAAVGGLLDQLGNQVSKNKIGAALGISSKDLAGNAPQQIAAIMKATKGQRAQLEKAFGGEQLKVLVDLGKTYGAAFDSAQGDVKTKTKAATDALAASLGEASKSAVTWADLQKEAGAQMQEGPQRIALAMEKLRQAVAKPEVVSAIEKMINTLPKLADFFGGLANFAATNPGAAITAAIVASIAKASIGSAIGELFKGMGPAGMGLGVLGVAAAAAAAAIYDYEATATEQREGLQSAPALIARAKAQLAKTGEVDKDTLDALARQRAEFEGVRGASEGGGVEQLSYTQILAAKLTGGADQIAAAEATSEEAKRLGPEGVKKTIDELDALIAAAAPVKQRPAAEIFGGDAPTAVGPPTAAAAQKDVMTKVAQMPGMDPNQFAQLTGQAIAGKVLKVEVVGGAVGAGGPGGVGPVTPGSRPR
jgi:hypothetical protein